MEVKLYVGNLPFSSSEEDLKEHFNQIGEVSSAIIIRDRETGRSRGFGFVEMFSRDQAEKAIEMLNGQDMQGRNLTVNFARSRPERSGGRY